MQELWMRYMGKYEPSKEEAVTEEWERISKIVDEEIKNF